MPNEENLRFWKKGESGNPNGRPKGSKNRSTIAKKWLQVLQETKNPLTLESEELSQEDRKQPFNKRHGTSMVLAIRKWDFQAFRQVQK